MSGSESSEFERQALAKLDSIERAIKFVFVTVLFLGLIIAGILGGILLMGGMGAV